MPNGNVETVNYPMVRVRREVSRMVDEEWEVLLSDGKPQDVTMRTIIYTEAGEPIVKSEVVDVAPSDVPAEVVSEVERHMVPRGAFD